MYHSIHLLNVFNTIEAPSSFHIFAKNSFKGTHLHCLGETLRLEMDYGIIKFWMVFDDGPDGMFFRYFVALGIDFGKIGNKIARFFIAFSIRTTREHWVFLMVKFYLLSKGLKFLGWSLDQILPLFKKKSIVFPAILTKDTLCFDLWGFIITDCILIACTYLLQAWGEKWLYRYQDRPVILFLWFYCECNYKGFATFTGVVFNQMR